VSGVARVQTCNKLNSLLTGIFVAAWSSHTSRLLDLTRSTTRSGDIVEAVNALYFTNGGKTVDYDLQVRNDQNGAMRSLNWAYLKTLGPGRNRADERFACVRSLETSV
jgi:hypothetical protein